MKKLNAILKDDGAKGYRVDACGAVYEERDHENVFIGSLNGRKLGKFIEDKEAREDEEFFRENNPYPS